MTALRKAAAAIAFGTLGCAGLSACQTTQQATIEPTDARLMKSSSANTAILSEAVSEALGGRKVTLAENVLTDKSTLVMDPSFASGRTMDSGFVNGRSLQKPDHFRLMTNGISCYLLHEESGKSIPLKDMNCQPL